jgi:hypothetical protein
MIVQALPLFTTVAQKFNQGLIRIRVVYRIRGPFCFFLDKQKEKEETSW